MGRLLNFMEKKQRFNSFIATPLELNVITGNLFCVLLNVAVYLQKLCPKFLIFLAINHDVIEITIPRAQLPNILYFLKNHTLTLLNLVIDYTVVDFPGKSLRFEMVLLLLSSVYNMRLKIRFLTNEVSAIYTITCLYKIGFWLEREIWDMFGVISRNHADLRRLLTDYGFLGHPLRKDFPLTGYFEYFFDDFIRNLLNIKVSLAQEMRYFFFLQSWKVLN